MSDLTQFRDHCRRMAADRKRAIPFTSEERALWSMLAAEVDAYMAGDPDVVRVPQPDDVALDFGEGA
jgi:hypothetical protein